MPNSLQHAAAYMAKARDAAANGRRRTVMVDGRERSVAYPFPSPGDWRDCWIYFLLIDRFNNPEQPPRSAWNRRFDFRQGGTFEGVRRRLGYLEDLGVKALWLSPVLKNARPDWQWNYHGYGAQDFLNIDERFASDGTRETAERELAALVDEAHARGMHVILDIVLNHSARVFDYVQAGETSAVVCGQNLMSCALGGEPSVRWLNGYGYPRGDWENRLDAPTALHPDDAVWPEELQTHLFFRRRGAKLTDKPEDGLGFVRGDFGDLRQLVLEYDALAAGQGNLRAAYGRLPVLSILVRCHQYLMARYDFDGYRIDTVKYVHPEIVEMFGNAMREFAFSIGKKNFFTFGEVYDNEETIARFVGRNGGDGEGFGIDAALDFPLFYKLPAVAKGQLDVRELHEVFRQRKAQEAELLSSHGEAGRFFVSFLDNHDQHERIKHPDTPDDQVALAVALMFTLPGIPCLYYGTEQGLCGTAADDGQPDLSANESSREALWGKPNAFDSRPEAFEQIRRLSDLRRNEPALTYGRLYFREVSRNGLDFGHSYGRGGLVAFSRILADQEVLVVANTGESAFSGFVLVDRDLHAQPGSMQMAFSSKGAGGSGAVQLIPGARFHGQGGVGIGQAAALPVDLAPHEVQILR